MAGGGDRLADAASRRICTACWSTRPTKLDPGFGFDAFMLEASWCEPLGAAQDSLVDEPRGERAGRRAGRPAERASWAPTRCAARWRAAAMSPSARAAGSGSTSAVPPLPREPCRAPAAPARSSRGDRGDLCHPRRACRGASPGGAGCMTLRASRGPSGSRPNGGASAATARLRDYYRVEDGSGGATGSIARGWPATGAAGRPDGICTACSDEHFAPDARDHHRRAQETGAS